MGCNWRSGRKISWFLGVLVIGASIFLAELAAAKITATVTTTYGVRWRFEDQRGVNSDLTFWLYDQLKDRRACFEQIYKELGQKEGAILSGDWWLDSSNRIELKVRAQKGGINICFYDAFRGLGPPFKKSSKKGTPEWRSGRIHGDLKGKGNKGTFSFYFGGKNPSKYADQYSPIIDFRLKQGGFPKGMGRRFEKAR